MPRQPEKNRPSTVLTVAYFDTSAWSHLYNGAILKRPGWEAVATPFDLSILRKAVSDRIISILLSVVALEELIRTRGLSAQGKTRARFLGLEQTA